MFRVNEGDTTVTSKLYTSWPRCHLPLAWRQQPAKGTAVSVRVPQVTPNERDLSPPVQGVHRRTGYLYTRCTLRALGPICRTKPASPFNKALLYTRSRKLKDVKEWVAWCKDDGWQGYGHWLDTGKLAG